MKKVCYTAFVAFWSSIATLLALNVLAGNGESSPETSETTYSLAQVAEHASLDDCWMAVEGKVYDITAYVEKHPTPPSVLEPWCGKEATKGMRTKGYGRDHSAMAWEMLVEYHIGQLVE